ncbi:hypothetical protein L9F63_027705, partial [Diploptera punctata]
KLGRNLCGLFFNCGVRYVNVLAVAWCLFYLMKAAGNLAVCFGRLKQMVLKKWKILHKYIVYETFFLTGVAVGVSHARRDGRRGVAVGVTVCLLHCRRERVQCSRRPSGGRALTGLVQQMPRAAGSVARRSPERRDPLDPLRSKAREKTAEWPSLAGGRLFGLSDVLAGVRRQS